METIGTWWMWAGFAAFVVVAIAVDLLVMERQGAHRVTMGEAARWSLLWFALAFVFVGERLAWYHLAGGAVIAGGIWLSGRRVRGADKEAGGGPAGD